jgi:hypothetical protein
MDIAVDFHGDWIIDLRKAIIKMKKAVSRCCVTNSFPAPFSLATWADG